MSPAAVEVLAPAKLTVSLRVTGRRADGYHLLDAEMVALDLADRLWLDPDGEGLELVVPAPGVDAGPDNLVRRALAAVGRRAGVRLEKRIPAGGGLGGGSADAAAVLRWAGCRDLTLAASLGADVPFCLLGGRARVRGVGELVEPLAFRPAAYVLALVPLAVDTPAVYRAFDRAGAVGPDPGGNDLTAAALAVEPALAGWRDALARATGRTPRLAGSGATWFVEGPGPPDLPDHLELGGRRAALVRAQAVPAGWGDPPKVTGRDDPAP